MGAATLAVEGGLVAGRELASTVALGGLVATSIIVAGRRHRAELAAAALLGPAIAWGAAHALDAAIIAPLELSVRVGASLALALGAAAFVSTEAARRRASARASADP